MSVMHQEQYRAWQVALYPLLLFTLLESLVYSTVEDWNVTSQLAPLTAVILLAILVTELKLTLGLYLSNLLVGSLSILYFVHNSFYLQPLTDTAWLGYLYADLAASIKALAAGRYLEVAPSAYTLAGLILAWFVAAFSFKRLIRKGKITGLLALGLILQGFLFSYVNRSFTGANFAYMLAGLLLLSLVRLAKLQAGWAAAGVRSGEDLSPGWIFKAFLLIALLVSAAVTLPRTGASILQNNPQLQALADTLSGASPAATSQPNDHAGDRPTESNRTTTGFGWSDTRLGGPWKPDTTFVMSVTSPYETYWRGGAKNIYTGEGWSGGTGNLPAAKAPYQGIKTQQVEQTFRMGGNFTSSPVLFGAAMVEQVSGLNKRTNRDYNDNWLVGGNLTSDTVYKVISQVPVLDRQSIELLRNSGTDYPLEIRKSYLALPYVPERVQQLARQITNGKDNPYDKAAALVDYFQTNEDFVYDLNPPPTPPGRDFVDYFLEIKRGYCTYYSTAMAVMARSVGLPSRWVTGYTSGTTNERTPGTYQVTAENMHAWVEIYFNGVGWISFEPTKSFFLPSAEEENQAGQQNEQQQNPLTSSGGVKKTGELTGVLGILILSLGTGFFWWRKHRVKSPAGDPVVPTRRRTPRRLILIFYRSFLRLMAKVGRGRRPSQTAREFAAVQAEQFRSLAEPIGALTVLFEQARYGKSNLSQAEVELAEHNLELVKAGWEAETRTNPGEV